MPAIPSLTGPLSRAGGAAFACGCSVVNNNELTTHVARGPPQPCSQCRARQWTLGLHGVRTTKKPISGPPGPAHTSRVSINRVNRFAGLWQAQIEQAGHRAGGFVAVRPGGCVDGGRVAGAGRAGVVPVATALDLKSVAV